MTGRRHGWLVAGALALVLAPAPASALASGPGITVFTARSPQPVTLSGDQIAAAADTGPTPYTLRAAPGTTGQRLTLSGLSVRGLLALAGVDPDAVQFISVMRSNGSLAVLRRADFADPPPFPEGPALVTDEGSSTRFFRPVRDLRGTNAVDNVIADAGPLEVTVDGGALLAVTASVNRPRVSAGDTVTFSARVRFPPPGATLTYHWEFGDGTSADGRTVTHTYTATGDLQAQVSVQGSGSSQRSCAQVCGGVAAVDIRVGDPPQQTVPRDPTPGSGTGNPQAPGSSTGDGAGGTGGSGGGTTPGASGTPQPSAKPRTPKPKPKPKPAAPKKNEPEPAPREIPGGRTITGVLLSGPPMALTGKLPAPEPDGGSPKEVQATRGGSDDPAHVGGSVLVALAAVCMGALRERRRVRLRLS